MYSCGHLDKLLGNQRGKPTASTGAEGSSPAYVMASRQDMGSGYGVRA